MVTNDAGGETRALTLATVSFTITIYLPTLLRGQFDLAPTDAGFRAAVLHCPCHDGFFDLRSGNPIADPARRPCPRITLDVRGQDVYARSVETRTA